MLVAVSHRRGVVVVYRNYKATLPVLGATINQRGISILLRLQRHIGLESIGRAIIIGIEQVSTVSTVRTVCGFDRSWLYWYAVTVIP